MDEYSWASAVGRIRVLEKRFLSKEELGRLALSADLHSALGALRDTPYESHIARLAEATSYEEALQESLVLEYKAIEEMSPEESLIRAFRARHDFHNVKVIAKTERLQMADNPEAYSKAAVFDAETLKKRLFSSTSDELTRALALAYRDATALDEREAGVSTSVLALWMDASVDRAYYAYLAKVARKHGYEDLIAYVEKEIDLLNLRMCARGRKQGIEPDVLSLVFLPEGTVSAEALRVAYRGTDQVLSSVYKGTPYDGLLGRGLELIASGSPLTLWEKSCDDLLMELVRRARYRSLGPEPAYGYVFGKEAEARNLRMILAGKESLVPAKEITERLREPYV